MTAWLRTRRAQAPRPDLEAVLGHPGHTVPGRVWPERLPLAPRFAVLEQHDLRAGAENGRLGDGVIR
jgi:hypothetical protein